MNDSEEHILIPADKLREWCATIFRARDNSPGKNAREGMAHQITMIGEEMERILNESSSRT